MSDLTFVQLLEVVVPEEGSGNRAGGQQGVHKTMSSVTLYSSSESSVRSP